MKSLLLFLLLLATTASAASFDCTKAKTETERTICSNENLSSLDETLNEKYEQELTRENAAKSIRAAQKAWLEVRNRCRDSTCLEEKYEQRIADLTCDPESRMAGSAIGANLCSAFQIRLAEKHLAPLQMKFVSQVVASSNNPEYAKQVLAEEEKTWRAYRNAKCALHGEREGGSDGWKNAWGGMCVLDEMTKRQAYLEHEIATK